MKYIALITLLLNISTQAMVIDENSGNTLSTPIKMTAGTIGIFGATPSYGHYRTFYDTIKQQYATLYNIKDLSKSDPEKSKKKLQKIGPSNELKQIFKKNLTDDFKAYLENFSINSLTSEKLKKHAIDLFLATAINKTILKKNITELYKTAAKTGNLLVHLFLPSYFRGLGDEKAEDIQRFLVRSAAYYSTLYKTVKKELTQIDNTVLLVIPKISCIVNKTIMDKNFDALEPAQQDKILLDANVQTIRDTVITKLSPTVAYAFINHNTTQNEQLIKLLDQKQTVNSIALQTFGGKVYRDFTPYDGSSTKKFLINNNVQQFFETAFKTDLEK